MDMNTWMLIILPTLLVTAPFFIYRAVKYSNRNIKGYWWTATKPVDGRFYQLTVKNSNNVVIGDAMTRTQFGAGRVARRLAREDARRPKQISGSF